MLAGLELDVVLSSDLLLIGIVKKNAIMMVDFALEAERVRGRAPPKQSIRRVSFVSAPS